MSLEKFGEFAEADRALRLDRVLGDAELGRDLLLRQTIDLPQSEDLPATRGQRLDGLGQEFEFLGVDNRLRDIRRLIQDALQIEFR